MSEKTIKRNLVMERAHWNRLGVIAANAEITRAQLIRLVVRGVCEAKDPSVYLPHRAAAFLDTRPVAKPPAAIERPPTRRLGPDEIWVCLKCFALSPLTAALCVECGAPPVPTPIPGQPHQHDIPADWVNRYGLTVQQQERYEENLGLDYWPPAQAPAAEPFPDWWFEEDGPCEGQVNPQKAAH
jgi:hypothetical protein